MGYFGHDPIHSILHDNEMHCNIYISYYHVFKMHTAIGCVSECTLWKFSVQASSLNSAYITSSLLLRYCAKITANLDVPPFYINAQASPHQLTCIPVHNVARLQNDVSHSTPIPTVYVFQITPKHRKRDLSKLRVIRFASDYNLMQRVR